LRGNLDREQRGHSNNDKRNDPNTVRMAKHGVISFGGIELPAESSNPTKPAREVSRTGPTISKEKRPRPAKWKPKRSKLRFGAGRPQMGSQTGNVR
jgi:hypothetical protein